MTEVPAQLSLAVADAQLMLRAVPTHHGVSFTPCPRATDEASVGPHPLLVVLRAVSELEARLLAAGFLARRVLAERGICGFIRQLECASRVVALVRVVPKTQASCPRRSVAIRGMTTRLVGRLCKPLLVMDAAPPHLS